MSDKLEACAGASAAAVMAPTYEDAALVHGHYDVVCTDADGNEKWRESFDNLVTTVGKNKLLDSILGNAAAGAVVMGLKGTGAAAAVDTQASHAAWSEVGGANAPAYTGNRPTPAFSAAAAGSKATSAAVAFAITSTGTVAGAFINIGGLATKDDTTGTLFSAGDFAASRSVASGDTVNVTYTLGV